MRARADIDLAAVADNVRHFRGVAPSSALCVVVKADGYGHGAVAVARAALAAGAQQLAVVSAAELVTLRGAGIDAPVLVMGVLTPDELEAAVRAGGEVVAWTPEFLRAALDIGARGIHIKLDTGMGRLGTRDGALATALVVTAASSPGIERVGVMSHFATADERGDTFFGEQLARFSTWVHALRADGLEVYAHTANSAAALRDPASHFDMIRAGVGIYGLDPFGIAASAHGLRPVLSLHSTVGAVARIEAGESAGYGRRFVASSSGFIATVPIGYGDGWRRGLTNSADVLIGGRRYPQVGTVSMDNVTVNLGQYRSVEVGDEVVLLGRQGAEEITAEQVANALGTINYEVTCGLLPRVGRRTLEPEEAL